MIINTGAGVPINNPSAGGAGSAPTTSSSLDPVVAKMLKSAGLTLADMGSDFSTMPAGRRRIEVLTVLAARTGLSSMELSFLLAGKAGTKKLIFESAVRYMKAGVGILPRAFMKAVAEGKVICGGGRLPATVKAILEANGGVVRVKGPDDIVSQVNQGALVFLPTEGDVELLRSQMAKHFTVQGLDGAALADKLVRESVVTPERLKVDAAIETGFNAQILGALLPKATVCGDGVKAVYGYSEVEFDFAAGTIDDQKVLKTVVSYGRLLDRCTVLGLFGLSLLGVKSQGSAAAKIRAAAPSTFEEPDYGYGVRSSRYIAKIESKVGHLALRVDPTLLRPELSDSRSNAEVVRVAQMLWDRGEVVAFESQMGYAVRGEGAKAMLVGRKDQQVRVWTDASKEAKMFTRAKLAAHVVAETCDASGKSTIVDSGFGVRIAADRVVRDKGTRFNVWITNSGLSPGSGVCLSREGIVEGLRVMKTINGVIDAVFLPVNKDGGDYAQALVDHVRENLRISQGKIPFGGTVAEFHGQEWLWDNKLGTAEVEGQPKITAYPESDTVKFSLRVKVELPGEALKLTTNGAKLTNIGYKVECRSLDGTPLTQPDILLDKEAIKGVGSLALVAWADDVYENLGGALVRGFITPEQADTGVVLDPDTDLTSAERQAFETWRDARSFRARISVRADEATRTIVAAIVKKAETDPEWAEANGVDPTAFQIDDRNEVITQEIEVLESSLVLGVELSTVPENVGTAKITGEMLVALRAIDPGLGNQLWNGAFGRRKAVQQMILMARGVAASSKVTEFPSFDHDQSMSGRALIKELARKFPEGLSVVRKDGNGERVIVTLHFQALLEFGALLPGGSATGLAQSVLRLIDHMHVKHVVGSGENRSVPAGWDTFLARLISNVLSDVIPWVTDGKAALAGVTGTGRVFFSRKVKTTFSPTIANGEVGINPADPEAQLLAGRDVVLEEGMRLSRTAVCLRMPMISAFAGDIVVTQEAPVGTLLVKAHEWAMANEGDSDGDGVIFYVLRGERERANVKLALLSSPLGPMGYRIAHGAYLLDHPYTQFYTENASKRVHGVSPKVFVIEGKSWLEVAGCTGQHYSFFMGRVFAMASYLIFKVGNGDAAAELLDPDLLSATVLAWRRLYEGLALSGYSREAGVMAKLLAGIASKDVVQVPVAEVPALRALGIDARATTGGDKAWVKAHNAMAYAWHVCLGIQLSEGEAKYLYDALLVTASYSLIEREAGGEEEVTAAEVLGHEGREHLAPYLKEAVVYGTLRRGSKGLAVAAPLGEEAGNGLFRFMRTEYLTDLHGMVRSMTHLVWFVQQEVAKLRTNDELVEE